MSQKHAHTNAGEHPHSHALQLTFVVLYAVTWILDSFVLNWSTFPARILPLLFRILLGVIVAGVGLALMDRAHRLLFHAKSTGLVTHGVLSHVRHPLYLGTLLLYLGGILATFSLLTLVLWIVIAVGYDRLATHEEHKLEEKFGQVYRDYKKRVSKWIPH
jgi:protein-S-isoprenylcysteine O-methyltransferase Ste14